MKIQLFLILLVLGCRDNYKKEEVSRLDVSLKIYEKIKEIKTKDWVNWKFEVRDGLATNIYYYYNDCLYKTFIMKNDNDGYLIKSINDGDTVFTSFNSHAILDSSKYIFQPDIFIGKYQLFKNFDVSEIEWQCENHRIFIRDNENMIFYDDSLLKKPQLGRCFKIEGNWYYSN